MALLAVGQNPQQYGIVGCLSESPAVWHCWLSESLQYCIVGCLSESHVFFFVHIHFWSNAMSESLWVCVWVPWGAKHFLVEFTRHAASSSSQSIYTVLPFMPHGACISGYRTAHNLLHNSRVTDLLWIVISRLRGDGTPILRRGRKVPRWWPLFLRFSNKLGSLYTITFDPLFLQKESVCLYHI